MQETWVWSLCQEDPLEKEMATHSSVLAWEIPWKEKPSGLWSIKSKRVRCEWATEHTHTHHQCVDVETKSYRGEENLTRRQRKVYFQSTVELWTTFRDADTPSWKSLYNFIVTLPYPWFLYLCRFNQHGSCIIGVCIYWKKSALREPT